MLIAVSIEYKITYINFTTHPYKLKRLLCKEKPALNIGFKDF